MSTGSSSFDEKFTGVFELQDTISQRIAAVLVPLVDAAAPTSAQGRAPGSVHANLTGAGGTRNSDAYQLYLAARQFAQGVSAAGLRKSIELYNKALDFDPAYALAYAGLVESYRRMIFGADVSPVEAFEPAKIAAQRGMALAPELAEAHAGLGCRRWRSIRMSSRLTSASRLCFWHWTGRMKGCLICAQRASSIRCRRFSTLWKLAISSRAAGATRPRFACSVCSTSLRNSGWLS